MQIGFIGLGLMGRPMALNLSKAGHTLHLWARRPASLDPFKAVDAKVHASPAEVAKNAEIVFTIVADAPDVQAVALGENGVAAGAKPGLIVVDMSTINPNAAREIGASLAAKDRNFASTVIDLNKKPAATTPSSAPAETTTTPAAESHSSGEGSH